MIYVSYPQLIYGFPEGSGHVWHVFEHSHPLQHLAVSCDTMSQDLLRVTGDPNSMGLKTRVPSSQHHERNSFTNEIRLIPAFIPRAKNPGGWKEGWGHSSVRRAGKWQRPPRTLFKNGVAAEEPGQDMTVTSFQDTGSHFALPLDSDLLSSLHRFWLYLSFCDSYCSELINWIENSGRQQLWCF